LTMTVVFQTIVDPTSTREQLIDCWRKLSEHAFNLLMDGASTEDLIKVEIAELCLSIRLR
jgi:hypothetical protein